MVLPYLIYLVALVREIRSTKHYRKSSKRLNAIWKVYYWMASLSPCPKPLNIIKAILIIQEAFGHLSQLMSQNYPAKPDESILLYPSEC